MSGKQMIKKGCLPLFAAVFFIVGLIPGFYAAKSIYRSYEASRWQPVAAQIITTELKTSRSDNTDTYKVVADYRYQFGGREYSGNRVSFSDGYDNIGSFHQDTYRLLEKHRREKTPFTARVNPENPAEAILLPEVRWGMIAFFLLATLIFSGAGAAVYVFNRRAGKKQAAKQDLREQYPEEPWKWNPRWHSNSLRSDGSTTRWIATGFALFWNLVSAPVWFFLPAELQKGNYVVLIAAIFPVIGIGLAIWAIRAWLQYRRFDSSTLRLKKIPFQPGEMIEASLQIPDTVPAGSELDVLLNRYHRQTTTSGGKTRTQTSVEWQTEQRLPVGPGRQRQIPIRILLPADQPGNFESGRSRIYWQLDIRADIPGVDYSAAFELPVFETVGSAAVAQSATDTVNQRQAVAETGLPGDPGRSGAVVDGMRFYFPAARHKGIATMTSLMGLVFAGIGFAIYQKEPSLLFAGFFVLVGSLAFLLSLNLWLRRWEIRIENGFLRLRSGWFRLRQRLRIAGFQIGKMYLHSSMSSGTRKYYDLYLEDHQGKRHKLAGNLLGRRDSEALLAAIKERLGIS